MNLIRAAKQAAAGTTTYNISLLSSAQVKDDLGDVISRSDSSVKLVRGRIEETRAGTTQNGGSILTTIRAKILRTSCTEPPCIGDCLVAECGPWEGQRFVVGARSDAIRSDESGAFWMIRLSQNG